MVNFYLDIIADVLAESGLQSLTVRLHQLYLNFRWNRIYHKKLYKLQTALYAWERNEHKRFWDAVDTKFMRGFKELWHAKAGEAHVLSSPIIRYFVKDKNFERAAELVIIARKKDRESRKSFELPEVQIGMFTLGGYAVAEIGTSGQTLLSYVQAAAAGFQAHARPAPMWPCSYPSVDPWAMLVLGVGYVCAKNICKSCRRKTDGMNHVVAAFCTGAYMARQGGAWPAVQSAVMMALGAHILSQGPHPSRSLDCWSPERMWWRRNVREVNKRLYSNHFVSVREGTVSGNMIQRLAQL